MRGVVTVALLGLASLFGPEALGLPAHLFGLAAITCGVLLAVCAAGRLAPAPLVLGAFAAVVAAVLSPVAPVIAGGAALMLAFAPRAERARNDLEVAIELAAALVAGAAATWITMRFASADAGLQVAAAGVSALVSASPMLLPVDDPVTVELRRIARRCRSVATRQRLEDAVQLRRSMAPSLAELPRAERRRMERAFEAIAALGPWAATGAGERSLDRCAGRILAALERARSAIERKAAAAGEPQSDVMVEMSRAVEGIEAEAAAIEDVRLEEGMRQWPR
jgi:hypothetical protein